MFIHKDVMKYLQGFSLIICLVFLQACSIYPAKPHSCKDDGRGLYPINTGNLSPKNSIESNEKC